MNQRQTFCSHKFTHKVIGRLGGARCLVGGVHSHDLAEPIYVYCIDCKVPYAVWEAQKVPAFAAGRRKSWRELMPLFKKPERLFNKFKAHGIIDRRKI